MKNATTWLGIDTANLPRATAFYEVVLGCKLQLEPIGPSQWAVFGYDAAADGVGGTLAYLDASPSLDAAMAQVA